MTRPEAETKQAVVLAMWPPGLARLVAYGVGQAIGYAIDLCIFFVLMGIVHLDRPIVAHLCGKFGSAALIYLYHARFSFPGKKANSRFASTIAYVATVLVNIALTTCVLKGLIALYPQRFIAAKIVSDVLCVLVTYLLMRTVVFRSMEA